MYVTLEKNGLKKQTKIGFSWTTFFFGFFVPLFRGDLKWAAIMFVSSLLLASFTFGIGSFIIGIIFSFIYNKLYIRDLIEKGWIASNSESNDILESNNVM
ncbi:DUF2628 domain-containing protein [Senegalia massiliensis]|uniref:DUF2628 domain-containing protein n=1 Tax=Senegalia massiliensis TaxID=1720316 RepID=UPI00102FEF62|nr:DUF2628 domain-containing protein [Senegalia massiliensis]